MRSVVLSVILALFLGVALAGCAGGGGGEDDPGEKAQISANAAIIVFAGGAGWGDVTFTHATHADEYYDGECIHCHDHETVGAETKWLCSECHSAGTDAEGLCEEYANHGCIMTQCQDCHLREGGNPAPDGDSCGDCHGSPVYAETIVFAGGGGYGPVGFTHKKHAEEYYEGDCLACHDHDEGVWICGDCHTRGADAEDLCVETEDHGCIMAQCQDCHVKNSPPAPAGEACGDCHGFPQYASTIEFPGGVSCESATFTHEQHAMQYSEGRCRDCHKMEADFWMCRICHTVGGVGGPNDGNCESSQYFDHIHDIYHGCIAFQCMQCHEQYPNDAPDGEACGDCHTGCDCPQDPCICSDCHDTYPLTHNDDACTKPGCHAYENHTGRWEPCTNDVCHVVHPPEFHTSWETCVTDNCHNTFPSFHEQQTCNDPRCHHDFPEPLPGEPYHNFSDNGGCIVEDTCHWPGSDYLYLTHQTEDPDDNCVGCHPILPHDPDPKPLPWASCANLDRCHVTADITSSHDHKACNDIACHDTYPVTHEDYEQLQCGELEYCHPFGDYPFTISQQNGSHTSWEENDVCENDFCHTPPAP